ncbi:MAG: hypothetical protein JRN12_02450 [Nitrososphaerota archaeon]|jgi:hypothetical protein|nr:hypothetical protein [Nitrososphaerota archaeon]MDG6942975.1 hypothetical protein [Nitrososphaerota archaeon]MDG6950703.1 hypothetical protein [Nitrososphaerota archaeon]
MDSRSGPAVVALAISLLLVSSSAAATQESGFVTYKVTLTGASGQHVLIVNETAGPAVEAGFSDLTVELTAGQQNLTYSKLVNSTSSLLPYLSTLSSQAFSYTNGTSRGFSANFSVVGTTTVTFHGSQYTLTEYSFSTSGSYGNRSLSVNGTLETFPSSLVYSAAVSLGNVSVQAVIQDTDLQLAQSSATSPSATAVGAGIGVSGFALAAALFVRRRDRKSRSQREKPLHWVD